MRPCAHRAFSDEGGVLTVLALVTRLHGLQHRDVVRAGLGALRQLSKNDGTKTLLAAHGAPVTLLKCAVGEGKRGRMCFSYCVKGRFLLSCSSIRAYVYLAI